HTYPSRCRMSAKVCSKCREEKSLEEFYNDKRAKSGKASRCRDCVRITKRAYLERTRKPRRPQWRIWTTEKIAEAALQYTSRIDFEKGNLPAYTAARRSPLGLDFFCGHMPRLNESWTFDKILAVARNYQTIKEFREGN